MINSKDLIKYTKNLSVLFVEDHIELRENTTEILKNFFQNVDSYSNGQEALIAYKKHYKEYNLYYDIILSDIQMPLMDGVELTQAIYKLNKSQTIVILSAYDESKYLLPLINIGIKQFIKKPIRYEELLNILLRISKDLNTDIEKQETNNNTVQINDILTFNTRTNNLEYKGNGIYLTKYEIIFLQLLVKDMGSIYSNNDIVTYYQENNEELDTQNIRKLVSKLRKKIPEEFIESVYSVGYRLI